MKKLTVIFTALLAVTLTAPVFAADNLNLSGSFRVRGWDVSDGGYVEDNDASYIDQRMRVQARIKASDNAYVVIRSDIGDGKWGTSPGFSPGGISRPGNDSSRIDFDRLYGVYENGMFQVTIGQQFLALGIAEVLDANMPAINVRLNFDGFSSFFIWGKIDENGSTKDDDTFEDSNIYVANVSFGAGGFDTSVYGAMIDDEAADTDAWVVGLHSTGTLGMVNLIAELDFLGGDYDDDTDYEGLQFYLSADVNLSEATKLGGEFFWAEGQDEDVQLTDLVDWESFTVADTNAPFANDIIVTIGHSVFDFTDESAGVIGGSLFGSYKVTNALTLGAKFAYLTPEDEDLTDIDSLASYTLWAAYSLGSNTAIAFGYNIADLDTDGADDESMETLYARFMISF